METHDYAEQNRRAWNQVAPIHRRHYHTDLRKAFLDPEFSLLDDIEKEVFQQLEIQGKTIAQFCCNNGRELISALRLGAAAGVGFDISDEFIAEAKELAELAKVECTFVRGNIFDIDAAYFQRFDILYITIGALCWFDDLQRFFKVASQVLKADGALFLYEMHPILDLFAVKQEDTYDKEHELKILYPYFNTEPWVDDYGLDYFGESEYQAETTYSFPHKFSEILNALISNGLNIRELREYPHDISATFKHLEKYQKIPMCYTLLARKPG